MRITQKSVIEILRESNKPMNFEQISNSYFENVDYVDLGLVISRLLEKGKITTKLADEGVIKRIYYELAT